MLGTRAPQVPVLVWLQGDGGGHTSSEGSTPQKKDKKNAPKKIWKLVSKRP